MPFISDLFRSKPGLIRLQGRQELSTFTPTCDDCQKYRDMIKQAHDNGNVLFLDALRQDFERHVEKEHTHAHHS